MKNTCIFIVLYLLITGCSSSSENKYKNWGEYLGGTDRNHYSTLSQIDTNNVTQLKVAWTYDAPDTGQMQMSPIMVNGIVYGVTAGLKAFALDAETGKQIWIYKDAAATNGTSRGVSYWEDGNDKRIFYTVGFNLLALDAKTGEVITSFADSGKLDLHTGLPAEAADKYITSNTPPTIYKNLLILSVRVAEDAGAAPGDIRAFDARSGKLAWSFHTIPHPGEKGYKTWPADVYKNTNIGAANNWAGMALDKKTGTLFIPTGSAAPDFYGANRKGANLFANCMLALNAADGSYKWHFQMMHHDLWDRDPASPPNLITVVKDGKNIDAVAQVTKQGYTFLWNRNTGEPIYRVDEVAAPASLIPGEQAWPTQPVPLLPKPFTRAMKDLSENDISPYAANKDTLKKILAAADKRLFAPPGTNDLLLFPGYDGGAEYGGAAADPINGIIYVNANEMAWFLKLDEQQKKVADQKDNAVAPSMGQQVYTAYCSTCHGKDRLGNAASGYPDLATIAGRQTPEYVYNIISKGKGMMPAFTNIANDEKQQLVSFLFGDEKKEAVSKSFTNVTIDAYKHDGYQKFLDDKGLPAISPPWGTLSAIDLNTGNFIWKITLGITPGLPNQDTNPTGCESYGGPVVTANGLLFIAATKDGMFRAFNRNTGKLLWQTKLPAASFGTPAMYEVKGKQFIVMACGGEKLGTPKGNKLIAFAIN